MKLIEGEWWLWVKSDFNKKKRNNERRIDYGKRNEFGHGYGYY